MISPGSGKVRFPTLAENVQLRIGQFQIFDLERQDLAGTQAIE